MKRAIIIVLIVLAAGAGAGAYYVTHKAQPLSVATAAITRADVVDAVASTGTLQPVISVTVGAQVSGNISWLGADFNSIVKKNQVIAKLDPTLFQSQVSQAQAQVAQAVASLQNAKAQLVKDQANVTYAQVTYKRTGELTQKGLATQDQLDQTKAASDQGAALVELDKSSIQQAQANVDQAKAQLSTSQTNLEHSIITSPIDGIVTQRSVDVGQTVQSSMTAPQLFVIAQDLTQMQVSANIDESDVGRVTPGENVTFRVDAFPGIDFHGTVAQIRLNPTVINNVTTYSTIVNVPNDDLRLKPGMTSNLKIQVSKRTDTLRVPNTALRFRPSLDAFAALNQPVPPEAQGGGRGRRGGAGGQAGAGLGGTRSDATAGAPAAGTAMSAQAPRPGGAQAGAGGRGGFGGGGRGGDPAERQARMMERLKGMSPDEQKAFIARLKDRGQDTSAFEQLLAGKPGGMTKTPAAADGAFVFTPRYGEPHSQDVIANLFRPVATPTSQGRGWVLGDHQLTPVSVRLGITDGTFTEVLGGDVQEGSEVVTGISGVGSIRTTAAAAGNPILGQQGRGGPGGGRGF